MKGERRDPHQRLLSIDEVDLGEVGENAKQGMGRELVGVYGDRPDTWLKVRVCLEEGA